MYLKKKVKCVHCSSIVEENGSCKCGKVKMINGTMTEGNLGSDYVDISAKLLNEVN
jgi:hypothetical protein